MNFIKTTMLAAGMIATATFAQAATVASIAAKGDYNVSTDGVSTELFVQGAFSAFADTSFDTSATNDFLFDLELDIDGLPPIDEELTINGITGDDILGFAIGLITDINTAFPGVLPAILAEVLDGNLAPTPIGPALFGFVFDLDGPIVDDSASGSFSLTLADGVLDNPRVTLSSGRFAGSAEISTVSAVPLPATLPLLAFGGAGLMALGRRRKG